ncbi:hypothetical protein HPP92_006898 [Vanilla planifolia]|uniref:Uncharacterized protein n=1 Tax=Vanilla planifolia TaxID=51239 RepID=A0A835RKR6_VANPL|nr:hypothetical protein HPP92_006898 [Vanilla planifolia]
MSELKKDPVLILRFDGEDLKEFLESTQFEPEISSIYSQIGAINLTLWKCITAALEKLTVKHGIPPSSDPWVLDNIVEPALQLLSLDQLEKPASEEIFIEEFRKFIGHIIKHLHEKPLIVAHVENTCDGSGIRRLLSNQFELNKLLDLVWRDLPKDSNAGGEFFRVAIDVLAPSIDLPHYGTVDQFDSMVNEICSMFDAKEEKILLEFKEMMTFVLGKLSLLLEENPICISSNSVVHEPLPSPAMVLPSSSLPLEEG